ncbi:MAG: O-antigen ligase family protein [Candidatus Pacebacteria bacterium]|nr:O-antigen ligase family protein [Candidatus Paceibacterota bacterium]
MGKQSRLKKERKLGLQAGPPASLREQARLRSVRGGEKLLTGIVFWGACLALFTPLIYSSKYYFPFVGPKSLYFMVFCQIVFFSWLILALYNKQYRPRKNAVLLAFGLFIFLMIVSTLSGVDPSRSFWSKFERMSGLLMWFNMFGLFLAVSSTLKTFELWKRIFYASLGVSFIVSLCGILEELGVKAITISDRGGFTLGNTSFLGSYLLFNFFLAIYLLLQEKKNLFLRIGLGILALLNIIAIYLQGARAALGVSVAGLLLVGVLYVAFKVKNKVFSLIGKVALVAGCLGVITSIVLLYLPNNPVHDLFGKMATEGRFANWAIAEQGFLDRPFFGWGPETYDILFPKYFNPCLFTTRCGGEFWFDRTHNIILDTLVAVGAFGFLAYLTIFFSFIWILRKKYFKEQQIDFWTFAIFTAILVAYFIQNLTVFDMVGSLMMFTFMLAFAAFLAMQSVEGRTGEKSYFTPRAKLSFAKSKWPLGITLFIGLLCFYYFAYKPWQLDKNIIIAMQAQYQNERLNAYQKALDISPLGKYQVSDFFADNSHALVQNNINTANKEDIIRELEFVINIEDQRKKDSPLDYRITLKLAQLYNTLALVDSSKIATAELYGQEAMQQSPSNQQSYWVLAQTKLYSQDFQAANELAQQALDLDPGVLRSYQVASQVASLSGDQDRALEIAKQAVAFNSDWLKEFSILPQATTTATTTE